MIISGDKNFPTQMSNGVTETETENGKVMQLQMFQMRHFLYIS